MIPELYLLTRESRRVGLRPDAVPARPVCIYAERVCLSGYTGIG